MTRLVTTLALLGPLLAVIILFRSLIFNFDLLEVAARFQLPWPLAVHPDSANSQAATDDISQQPLEGHVVSITTHHSPGPFPQHKHHENHKEVSGQFTRRIVAVGDLHGDLPNAQKVLEMAEVVDANGNWAGDVDFFVQTGDIIDRGDDTIKLYNWMDRLRDQAPAKGGTVLSHLGNHEWMNVIGDWRYVYPTEIITFGSPAERFKSLTTGALGRSWAANYTTTSRLPLHPSLGAPNTDHDPASTSPLAHAALSFVHGGLAPRYPDLTPFPSRINELGRSLLRKLQHRSPLPAPHPPNPYPGLPADATPAEHRLYGTDGPLWYRGWALDPEDTVCKAVDAVLAKTGTRRMIMGHTPDFQKIVSRCDGKIIIIDTGISHAYGGALSALSITYTLTPTPSADNKKHWKERELVTALYADRQEVLAVNERDITGNFRH